MEYLKTGQKRQYPTYFIRRLDFKGSQEVIEL